jgi:hypothetical protein
LPPDEIEKLNATFEKELRSLRIADRNDDPLGEIVLGNLEIRETAVFAMQRRSPTWW